MRLFGSPCVVLDYFANKGSKFSKIGDATYSLTHALSFDFVIIIHVMKEDMGTNDKLCQMLW